MKTIFIKKKEHSPNYFLIDAKGKTLGRLATEISKLLRGKEISYYSPGVDQGNYVAVINAEQITISGKKEEQKLYYRSTQRPGNLKVDTYKQLKEKFPARILEKAVWGMLPKGVLGRNYYKRLFVYSGMELIAKKQKHGSTTLSSINWIPKTI
jgi:large subunit ribosomal protein L13